MHAPTAKRRAALRPRILFLVLTLPLLTAGLAACDEEEGTAQAAPAPPTVDVARPVLRDLVEDDEFVGRFDAVDRVELRARVDGYLAQIHFQDGALVAEGDLLFTIDQRPFKARVDEARAAVNSAQAMLQFARDDLQRAQQLIGRNNIPQQTVDERQQRFLVAQAELARAEATLIGAQLELEYTEVRAPLSGRIDEKRLSVGNLVRANDTLLTTIVRQDPIYFYFDIDERSYLAYARDARSQGQVLQDGSRTLGVVVRLADRREAPRRGHLDFSENELDQATGTMRMRAVMENADGVLQPGLFGRVNVPGSLPYRGVLVPDEAIASDQERRIVYVVDAAGVATPRVIRPGPRLYGYRVVREGLNGDETIVVNGLLRVRPGAVVTPHLVELPPERE